jgi:hypothetical protein
MPLIPQMAIPCRNSFTGHTDESQFTYHFFGGLYLENPPASLSQETQNEIQRIRTILDGEGTLDLPLRLGF